MHPAYALICHMGWQRPFVNKRFIRFLLAGSVNTGVNFLLLNLCIYTWHTNKFAASIIATSAAIVCSFLLNRRFVFMDSSRAARKLARFAAVSALGVLLIQTSVYMFSLSLTTVVYGTSDALLVNLSNVLASAAVMFWNYNGYRLLVFTAAKESQNYAKDEETT